MVNNWRSVKLHPDTIKLIPEAKKVFYKHHPPDVDDKPISNDRMIRRALRYYKEN